MVLQFCSFRHMPVKTSSRFRFTPNQATHLSAMIQQRPWHDPLIESSQAIEQPQGAVADFSHVDLFSHAPVRHPIQVKLKIGEPITPNLQPNPIQRHAISKEEAETALEERAANFFHTPHQIIKPWADNEESNCHGYTVYREVGKWVDGEAVFEQIKEASNVAVFMRDGQLAHSGRLAGGCLLHLLIGVGVVLSVDDGENTYGYDARYNLPADIEALTNLMEAQAERARRLSDFRWKARIVSAGINKAYWGMGQSALCDQLYDLADRLTDGEEITLEDEMNVINAFNQLVSQERLIELTEHLRQEDEYWG